MKRLLILVDRLGEKKQFLVDYLQRNFAPGIEVYLSEFSDLAYEVDGKNINIEIAKINKNIKDFDLVYFRRAGSKYSISAGNLALCFKRLDIKFFDTGFSNIGPLGSKFTSYLRLSFTGLPTIPSFFCSQTKINDYKGQIAAKFGLPLVAKELGTQRGKGVFLIKNKEGFDNLPKKSKEGRDHEFMFQQFIKSDEEYRILVLGDKVGSYLRKYRTDPNEFRSNAALGAREEFLDVDKINSDLQEISLKAAKELGFEIAGVDVLVDENSKMWLLEVNRGPGLTVGSPEFTSLASFLEKETKS